MKNLLTTILFLLLTNFSFSQASSKVNNAQNIWTVNPDPRVLMSCDTLLSGLWRPVYKYGLMWNYSQVIGITDTIKSRASKIVRDSLAPLRTLVNSKQTNLGYTPVPNSRTVTINGLSYDLTLNRVWNVGTLTGMDTLFLASSVNSKLNKTDTTNKWQPKGSYLTSFTELDLLSIHSIDSSNMLNPYLRKSTAVTLYYSISNPSAYISNLSSFTTSNLTEGSNLYYTSARFNTSFGSKSTTDLTEGTNLYYTNTRFDTRLATKTTDNLTEGSTNQYFTNTRARASITFTTTGTGVATYNSATGALNIPTPTSVIQDYYNTVAIAGGGGSAVFYLTSDKTSTGTALYTTIDVVMPIINDVTQNYTYGWSYNSTTKALTVSARTNLTAVISLLTVVLGPTNVPNGTNIQVLVKGH